MKLSGGVRVNNDVLSYSYCGKYLAYAVQNKLFVVHTEGGNVACEKSCIDIIDYVEWSVDCDHILCTVRIRESVQAFSVTDSKWQCRVHGGNGGLERATWGPKGCHILTISSFNVKITIWSLTEEFVSHINVPVMKDNDPLSFSPNGDCLAVVTCNGDNYIISILSTSSWKILQEMRCTGAIQLPSRVVWSPNNDYFVIWDTVDVKKCVAAMYSVQDNELITSFQRENLSGIVDVAWSPNGEFLVLATCHQELYILNCIMWSVVVTLHHSRVIPDVTPLVFHEESTCSFKMATLRPVTFKDGLDYSQGATKLEFSRDGRYLATHTDAMPAVVWLWDFANTTLSTVLVFRNSVTDMTWHQHRTILSISTGAEGLTLWEPCKPKPVNLSMLVGSSQPIAVHKTIWRPACDMLHLVLLTDLFMYFLYQFDQEMN